MPVIGEQNLDTLLRPGGADLLDEPGRVGSPRRQARVGASEERRALAHETPQDGIDEAGGSAHPKESRGIHSRVDARLRSVPGVLNLVRGNGEQRLCRRGESLRTLHQ